MYVELTVEEITNIVSAMGAAFANTPPDIQAKLEMDEDKSKAIATKLMNTLSAEEQTKYVQKVLTLVAEALMSEV